MLLTKYVTALEAARREVDRARISEQTIQRLMNEVWRMEPVVYDLNGRCLDGRNVTDRREHKIAKYVTETAAALREEMTNLNATQFVNLVDFGCVSNLSIRTYTLFSPLKC